MNYNQKCINHLRVLSCEMITNAKSGHPGVALGAAPILYALFKDHYFYDTKDPLFIARDRFVLSAGHASSLFYACCYMFNFGVTENDMKSFRQFGSKTSGHVEKDLYPFVEVSTGPLGQGVANAVGLAIGQTMLGNRFNAQKYPVIDNYTYCFAGDGCLMEGVALEACSLAGSLKLNRFILLYDANNVTLDGKLNISNTENVAKKYKAMGFNVIKVRFGNSYNQITKAIAKAKKSANKPTIIIINTTIGYGSANQGSHKSHGTPLTNQELIKLKLNLSIETSFCLPEDVKEYVSKNVKKQREIVKKYNNMLVIYEQTNPDLYKSFAQFMENKPFEFLKIVKEEFLKKSGAGRDLNSELLNLLSTKLNRMVGGSADLASSTKTYLEDGGDYSILNRNGKNIRFGIREHSMAAICSGLTMYLKTPVFCSTFLAFSNYMIPAIRMTALMELPVMYFFTHDSYKVGEDGPTHQSVEQVGMLRLIPNLNVYRPADARELAVCYDMALNDKKPCAFVLAKQNLSNLNTSIKDIQRGGYIVSGTKGKVIILASGSEVEVALKVKDILKSQDIEVVVCSFPSLSTFEKQSESYKKEVLSKGSIKIAFEASNDNVWYKYIGSNGHLFGIKEFGKSAPAAALDEYYEFTATAISKKIKKLIK